MRGCFYRLTQVGGQVKECFLEAAALGALKGHVYLDLPAGQRLTGSPT